MTLGMHSSFFNRRPEYQYSKSFCRPGGKPFTGVKNSANHGESGFQPLCQSRAVSRRQGINRELGICSNAGGENRCVVHAEIAHVMMLTKSVDHRLFRIA